MKPTRALLAFGRFHRRRLWLYLVYGYVATGSTVAIAVDHYTHTGGAR